MQDTHHNSLASHDIVYMYFNYNKMICATLLLLDLEVRNRGVSSFLPCRPICSFSGHDSGFWNKNLSLFRSLEILVSSFSPCCVVIVALHCKDLHHALSLIGLLGNRQSNLKFLLDPSCLIQKSGSVKYISDLCEVGNLQKQNTLTVSDNAFSLDQYSIDLQKSADPSCSEKSCTTLSLEQHTNLCLLLHSC